MRPDTGAYHPPMAVGAIAIFETGDETGTRPWLALLFRSHAPVEDPRQARAWRQDSLMVEARGVSEEGDVTCTDTVADAPGARSPR
jgi:hypothetical protein